MTSLLLFLILAASKVDRVHPSPVIGGFGPQISKCDQASYPVMWRKIPRVRGADDDSPKWVREQPEVSIDPRMNRLYWCYPQGVTPEGR